MRVVIEGHDLPGAEFVSAGIPLHNVHVAVQIGKQPVGLVRGDADGGRWEIDVRTVVADGVVDLRGPAVHGKKGERFLYLTWGEVGPGDSFAMFRRAKLMIGDIDPVMLAAAAADDGILVASLSLTDERGGPRCARVKPPAIRLAAGLKLEVRARSQRCVHATPAVSATRGESTPAHRVLDRRQLRFSTSEAGRRGR